MKLVVIFAAVLVALAAIGGTAWWLVTSEDPHADMREAGLMSSAPQFLSIDALDVPVIEDGQVVERLTFVLTLDLAPGSDLKALKRDMPRIRDAMYAELHALFAMRIVKQQDNPLPLVKRRLREVADRTIGGGVVAEVLVSDLAKRRITGNQRYAVIAAQGDGRGRRELPKPQTQR